MYLLTDAPGRPLDAPFFALRASPGAGETLAIFKNISACQAPEWSNYEFFSLCSNRACYMRKMLINLFFLNSQGLGEFHGVHLLFTEKFDHLLTNRLHVILMFFLHLIFLRVNLNVRHNPALIPLPKVVRPAESSDPDKPEPKRY